MNFERNVKFDRLIEKVKENKGILKKLDYEQLVLFNNYLIKLNNHLINKGE